MTPPRAAAPERPAAPATVRRRVPLWLPAVAGGVLVVALVVGGGAPQAAPPGIPDPGPVTGWGLPLLRLLTDLAAVAAVGPRARRGPAAAGADPRAARRAGPRRRGGRRSSLVVALGPPCRSR